jgi:outer membrane receptor protein involved in Fe transport
VPSVGGLAGDRLPYVPKLSGSLRADYSWPLTAAWTGHAGAGLRMVGDRYSLGPVAISQLKTPAYSALDLNLSISNERWSIGLFAKNVTDKRAYLTDGAIQNGVTGDIPVVEGAVLQPRTVGISLDVKM